MNMYWLDTQIALGDKFILSVPRRKIKEGTHLAAEV